MRAAAAATLRTLPRAALAIPPRMRRRLLYGLGGLIVVWLLFHFWFRDSDFVKVEHVKVTGLTTRDAHRIEAALTTAAHDMTTLHVRQDALMSAVAGYTAVEDVVATPHFPHGLTIRVIEERPVAVLEAGGARLLLAADGSVLRGMHARMPLAAIRIKGSAPDSRLADPVALAELHVAAASPGPLARRIASVGRGSTRGLVVKLRNGPQIIFGDDTRVDAKWSAAVAVLADPTSRGASYVDVRLPERPVAGGLAAASLAPLDTATAAAAAARTKAAAAQLAAVSGATGATGPAGATGPPAVAQSGPTLAGGAASANSQP